MRDAAHVRRNLQARCLAKRSTRSIPLGGLRTRCGVSSAQPTKKEAASKRGLFAAVNVTIISCLLPPLQIQNGQSGGLLLESTIAVCPFSRGLRSRNGLNLGSHSSDTPALRVNLSNSEPDEPAL